MMGAVARDAEAGTRWRTTTAIQGGSDSVKNLLAAAADGHGKGGHVTLGIVATEAVAQPSVPTILRQMPPGSLPSRA